jgi:hypothetical protein
MSKKELYDCIRYCEEQNGISECKNCGLTKEMIDGAVAEERKRCASFVRNACDSESEGALLARVLEREEKK